MTNTMKKATVRELENLKGKKVFLRCDLNVPQNDDGSIADETRIVASLGTIRFLLDRGARVIAASHFGRPKNKDEFSLKVVFDRLVQLLEGYKLKFAPDCVGKEVEKMANNLKDGQLLLLENLRWYKEETANDADFAKKLSVLADYYVNDAFGAAHRAHASTHGITSYLPAVAGLLMEKEIKILGEAISNPRRPLTIVMGGKKVSDKIGVINGLLPVANNILVGGGMSYTFAKAHGGQIGNSLLDEGSLDYCRQLVKDAKARGVNLVLPSDSVVADRFSPDAHTMITPTGEIPNGWEGLDIGPKTVEDFKKYIAKSGTVIWNGPVGVSEFDRFANGTREIAHAIVSSGAVSIIGGGDAAAAVNSLGLADKFTHISTGGGASLEFLEGKVLPGVEALLDRDVKIK